MRSGRVAALALGAIALTCCRGGEPLAETPRQERSGIFRDLVPYRAEGALGEPFFLDRFETTWGDWRRYLSETGGDADARLARSAGDDLPVTNVTLAAARAFAEWRFCRLPRLAEWQYAATGHGQYGYPWGDLFRPEWVNSWELGLAGATPVGTFESGRDEGGAYDLLGNVAEWTESIREHWLLDSTEPGMLGLADAVRATARNAALSHGLRGLPAPRACLYEALGPAVPRLVVGGHFGSRLQAGTVGLAGSSPAAPGAGAEWWWERGAGERGSTVGVRLAADPRSLLIALLREPRAPSARDEATLRTFLRGQRERLAPALAGARLAVSAPGALARLLREELRQ